jgi:hypothetical protein
MSNARQLLEWEAILSIKGSDIGTDCMHACRRARVSHASTWTSSGSWRPADVSAPLK